MELQTINLKNCEKDYFYKSWELYESSFPSEEKRTLKEQNTIIKNENYNPIAFIKDENIVAILFFWSFTQHTFIEHFAVNPTLRGQSYGSKILEDFLSRHNNCILEIELLSDHITKKRFDFYKRFDFVINEHKHFQIPFRQNSEKLELLLLSYKDTLTKNEYDNLYLQMKNSLTVVENFNKGGIK